MPSEGQLEAAASAASAQEQAATAAAQAENERVAAAAGHKATNEQIAQTSGANNIRDEIAKQQGGDKSPGEANVQKALAAPTPSKPPPKKPPAPPSAETQGKPKSKPKAVKAEAGVAEEKRSFIRPGGSSARRRGAQLGAFDPRQRSQGAVRRATDAINAPGQSVNGPVAVQAPGDPTALPSGGFNPRKFEEDQKLLGVARG